ncbi:MAG: hypothetical protein KGJ90_06730 [Patescibacteria group bacterium]|nr:hypothetical protein [Patescibacteria group bacterium]
MSEEMSTRQAIDAIESGLRSLRAFEQASRALRKLESLETALAETESRLKDATSVEDDWKARRKEAEEAIGESQRKAASVVKRAEDEAALIVAQAQEDRKKILAEANTNAADIRESAKADNANILKKNDELRLIHESLNRDIGQKKQHLEGINAALKEHKDKLAQFIKG